MKKRYAIINYKKTVLIVLCIFSTVVIYMQLPIFESTYNTEKYDYNTFNKFFAESDICVLKYQYTTGSGWLVVYSTDEQLSNKNIVLYNAFDPRNLRDNNDYYLDNTAMLIVKINETKTVLIDEEQVPLLVADNITILSSQNGKKYYTISDLSIEGIIKSILGVFNHKYWMSY